MSTRDLLEQQAEKAGWNEDSQIELLCQYIENQQSDDAFVDFLAEQVAREADEALMPSDQIYERLKQIATTDPVKTLARECVQSGLTESDLSDIIHEKQFGNLGLQLLVDFQNKVRDAVRAGDPL